MKCTESRELRDLSMNQLNAKLSELYKELPSRKWAFERKYRQHILNLINQIKHEQTLRRKGLRTQGIWIKIPKTITTMKIKATALSNSTPKEWVLLPTIVITSQSPFYIIISWLRWYIEFDFFPTYKSK